MAEGNFGGGGSVRWAVDVNDDERVNPHKKTNFDQNGSKGCKAHGIDKDCGTHFHVAVKVPGIKSRGDFIEWLFDNARGNLTVGGGAARFALPIEDEPRQINVRWK